MNQQAPDNAARQAIARSHAVASEEISALLRVDPFAGHDEARVQEMRDHYGSNALPEPRRKSKLALLLEQFNNPLIFILFAAAILTSIVSDVAEAITIFFVVIFNAVIGYVQEQRAGERLKAVKGLTAPHARVMRQGEQRSIATEDLVMGDIVLLESGVHVPADLRLIESTELRIDESMLTGEPLPSLKNAADILQTKTPLGDRLNMAFAGTTVRKGRGRGMVTGLGEGSEIGKISKGINDAEETVSPLQERLGKFGKIMAIGITVIIAVIFAIGLMRDYDATTMLLTSIGLAVSAIPEGLPIAVTVALSIGVFKMARRNAIVRKMNAVETLGSTTVICSDKTGTLTRNQMTTVMIATDDRIFTLTGGGYDPSGTLLDDAGDAASPREGLPLAWTLRTGLLCTESSFHAAADGARELIGDPTEGAMIVAAEKSGMAERELERWKVRLALPFESERMFMAVRIDDGAESFYLIKGSLERLIEMCDRELRYEGLRPLDRAWIEERQTQLSGHGLRVIATAYRPVAPGEEMDPLQLRDCIFTGLQGIEDPPREEARAAVAAAHDAGIKVVMITGDHIATAVSIARQLGLGNGRPPVAIAGTELEAMSDQELYDRVLGIDVYARVAPEHKLRIVSQLQKQGQVVAMTGDGVNDAPALKQSDIGIAMGSGTDVAREAAAMVVQDDSFATIVSAIRYGRVMFRNLQHMVLYVLTTSTGGMLTLAAAVVLGFPLPMIAVQLLWINLVTDGTSTIPLAYEQEHGDTMTDLPRKRSEGLLNGEMGERIIGVGMVMMFGTLVVFELVLKHHGYTVFAGDIPDAVLTSARTAAFTTLALFQIWNVHNSRALKHSIFQIGIAGNRPLLVVTIIAVLLQVAAVELPFMHNLLSTTGMARNEWFLCVGVSLSLVVLVELRKWGGRVYEGIRAREAAERNAGPGRRS
ncbi:MAG: cation-transporting ATPase, family [Chlorobi bacterium]|nr:cation-transporting ATPase, family [Chlorobiota bacterium]